MSDCMVCGSSEVASKCMTCGSVVGFGPNYPSASNRRACSSSSDASALQAQVKTLEAALRAARADSRTVLKAFWSLDTLAIYDRLSHAGLSPEDEDQVRGLPLCDDGGQLLEAVRRITKS